MNNFYGFLDDDQPIYNTEIEELRIYWSDGSIQTLSDVPVDRAVVIEQD